MKKLITIAALAMLSSCAQYNPESAGQPPTDHKAAVANYIKTTFFDPYSLRDVAISDPVPGIMFYQSGYLVCFQANAKNRMGGYIGIHRTGLLLRNDAVIAYLDEDSRCYAPELAMAPWPEMEGR